MVSGMGNGLGGATKQSKTPTETADRATRMKTAMKMARSDSGEKEGANWIHVSDMETVETKAQFTPKSHNNSTLLNEVITSNSTLSTCHNNPVDFDAQVQEIDVALGTYDSHASNVAFNLTTTSHGSVNNVAPSLNITSHDLANNVAPNLNDTSHDSAINAATLTSS